VSVQEIDVVDFANPAASSPEGNLIFDAAGDLFGMTSAGGSGAGIVFEIAHGTTTLTPLYDFGADPSDPDEAFPQSLVMDANGDLFGTTYSGGTDEAGEIFEIPHTGTGATGYGTREVLYSFTAPSVGYSPGSGLVVDSAGDLFGITSQGGSGFGSVWELTSGGTLNAFDFDFSNGAEPSGALAIDAAGDVFGTTQFGGAGSAGTVFELQKKSGGYSLTTLATFTFTAGVVGVEPEGGVTIDAAGDLLVTTSEVSGGPGVVFEIPHTGTGYGAKTLLYDFGNNGALFGLNPTGDLIADAAGNLFGTTSFGGSFNAGTVFELKYTVNNMGVVSYTPIVLFNLPANSQPQFNLTADAQGDLFGTTTAGGTHGVGLLFELKGTGFEVVSTTNSFVHVGPASVTADGVSTSTITVVVQDASGAPIGHAYVQLSSSPNSGVTIKTPTGYTAANGEFTATISSTKAAADTITAVVDGSSDFTATVNFEPGPPSAATST
jgi:uncharacterized repeat protein (TIGR03803 family)